eukprot:1152486-Pelagomonas_calceolata.AAC.1
MPSHRGFPKLRNPWSAAAAAAAVEDDDQARACFSITRPSLFPQQNGWLSLPIGFSIVAIVLVQEAAMERAQEAAHAAMSAAADAVRPQPIAAMERAQEAAHAAMSAAVNAVRPQPIVLHSPT